VGPLAQTYQGRSMRSLVIEDEPQIGAYLGRLLGQLGGIVDIVETLTQEHRTAAVL
jgi:two-component system, OmpR family, response regulator